MYTAWPKLSMPPCPSRMLYDRQAMMAMPICDSMVIDRPLVQTSGATSSSSANRLQTSQRPVLNFCVVLEECVLFMASTFARAQQTAWPEDQDQHEKQVRQDGRDLRQREFGEGVGLRTQVHAQLSGD